MIASLLLLATARQSHVRVLELVEDSPLIVVQAYVKAPAMTRREVAAWQVLGRVLLQGTTEYSPQTLRDYGSQAGVAPTVTVMPDFMRVQFVVPKSGLSLACDFVSAVLTRPALREQDVTIAIAELRALRTPAWIAAMSGVELRYDLLRPGDVKNLWIRTVRPENLNFVVAGGIDPGAGRAGLERSFERWNPARDPGSPRADAPPTPILSNLGPASTFVLAGRTMTPASAASAAKLAAVFALGVGKGSSMHRVLREQLGMSYMQSAVLWPTSKGWKPYFLMVRRTQEDEGKCAIQMKESLLKDVETWTEASLVRARAMAEAAFTREFAFSPIWLGPNGPRTQSLFDRSAWRGYLEMTGSGALREELLLGAMQNVDLDQLKEQAKTLLEECNVGWLPGR